jgi:biotin carboxyl carrier protein
MTGLKKLLGLVFFLVLVQGLISSLSFVCHAVDFLDRKNSESRSHLGWDTKVPVGLVGKTAHYITLPMGTPLSAIPFKISQKRTEIGLSPEIFPHEQGEFFQNLPWETAKAILIKSPITGYVVRVYVQQGQLVMAGDLVCTLEIMKMHMNISAGTHGEVRDIFFKTGDMVDPGSNLISLLPASPDWERIDQEKILDNQDVLMSLFPWATKITSKPSKTLSPNNESGSLPPSKIFDNTNYLILLSPWMAEYPHMPSYTTPPHKSLQKDMLTALHTNEYSQQILTSPETLSPKIKKLIINHSDQNHKVSMDNAHTTFEVAEKPPSTWQREKASIYHQEIPKEKLLNTSGISTWIQWLCGLAILSKLASFLQSLSCNLWRRVRFNVITIFPRTAYLCVNNFNKYLIIKNKTAHNRNRRYFVKWKVAS